jgi:hypothetical protein
MRLHHPAQWFFLFPENLYFSSCDSGLLGVRYGTYQASSTQMHGKYHISQNYVIIVISMISRTQYGLWYHLFPAKRVSGL